MSKLASPAQLKLHRLAHNYLYVPQRIKILKLPQKRGFCGLCVVLVGIKLWPTMRYIQVFVV